MTALEAKKVLSGLLDAFDQDEHGDYFYDHGWEVCEAVILAMSAFGNQTVHGRWVNEVESYPERYGWVPITSVVCSICEKSNGKKKPYCPNCGAKMDGE